MASVLIPPYPPGMPFWRAMMAGLVKPIESEPYLKWVRSLPCVITGRPANAHHIVGHGLKPVGGKTSDLMTFPLCPELHLPDFPEGLHRLGHKAWEARHGDQRVFVMQTLIQAVYDGALRLP